MPADTRAGGAVRMLYRPVGTLSGVMSHVLADAVCKWVCWRTPGGQRDRALGALQSKYRLREADTPKSTSYTVTPVEDISALGPQPRWSRFTWTV